MEEKSFFPELLLQTACYTATGIILSVVSGYRYFGEFLRYRVPAPLRRLGKTNSAPLSRSKVNFAPTFGDFREASNDRSPMHELCPDWKRLVYAR